jgi:hypothetical protein
MPPEIALGVTVRSVTRQVLTDGTSLMSFSARAQNPSTRKLLDKTPS